ncbi:hypothetical protein BWI17_13000 [Betaproteobacteria bacterium GR16-43]|nr:hypothetical protein BWI17_13000 [Betaproteobacteria bacterium GR16-43]
MKLRRTVLALAVAMACSTSFAQVADIVLTPAAGAGVSITDATGTVTRLRVGDDSAVQLGGHLKLPNTSTTAGILYIGPSTFLHNMGTFNTFAGRNAGNASAITGIRNAGFGGAALFNNTTGTENTALGESTLVANIDGRQNVAAGYLAMLHNTSGDENVGIGFQAILNNTTGNSNIGIGWGVLNSNTTGSSNIAIGRTAGIQLTTGNSNIDIGNQGVAGEGNTIRIGDGNQNRAFIAGIRGITTGSANAIPVMIDANGQLGTLSSSARFKEDVADMGDASDALMQLRPITFHYRADQDPAGRTLQYGLVAEEVEKVLPGLVAHSADGQVETVMYHFLPPMLLNQVQKQQRTIDAQAAELRALRGALAAIERRLERLGSR